MIGAAPSVWAIIPAAGIGARFGASTPKQYMELLGKSVLWHSVHRLLEHPWICGAVIATAADDPYFHSVRFNSEKPIFRCTGGASRAESVLSALQYLAGRHPEPEQWAAQWVAVHDAARPGLSAAQLDAVLQAATQDSVGALLVQPLRDTIKRSSDGGLQTLDRRELYAAQTPQVFRAEVLCAGLEICDRNLVTDEAQAIELLGLVPKLVEGGPNNLKITEPVDLAVAGFYLSAGS